MIARLQAVQRHRHGDYINARHAPRRGSQPTLMECCALIGWMGSKRLKEGEEPEDVKTHSTTLRRETGPDTSQSKATRHIGWQHRMRLLAALEQRSAAVQLNGGGRPGGPDLRMGNGSVDAGRSVRAKGSEECSRTITVPCQISRTGSGERGR